MPLAALASTPAACHSFSSALCVPLSSPREAKGALGGGDLLQGSGDVGHAGNPGGIALGADDDEVVVHDIEALHALAVGDELLLVGLGVHEQHVTVTVAGVLDRLAGADRHHAHLDPGLVLEQWQQMAEQSRLLGRGGRLDDDELVLGPDGAQRQRQGEQRCQEQAAQHGSILPIGSR